MNLSVGIIGLPNVGKSTLFNALLKKQQALAANYPFATIEPNVGIVAVSGARLEKVAAITKEEEKMTNLPPIKPATVEFVDIAGLVKGASEGAGLGNKFLSHIREVKIIAHVVRAFEDTNIIKEGAVDPKSDYETINTELMLSDIQTLEKINLKKHESVIKNYAEIVKKFEDTLNENIPLRGLNLTEDEVFVAKELCLLSAKPELIVLNVSEEDYTPEGIKEVTEQYTHMLKPVILNGSEGSHFINRDFPTLLRFAQNDNRDDNIVVICAKIESDLSELSGEEQKQYLADLGLEKSGLERLIQKAYSNLGLISFLTAGEKEVRAWTIRLGFTSLMASGEIHTDFMKKFIKAEIVSYNDFVSNNGWKGAREKGKARLEGKEYIMHDGDVVEFKIGS